jgi:hypothetical protein
MNSSLIPDFVFYDLNYRILINLCILNFIGIQVSNVLKFIIELS